MRRSTVNRDNGQTATFHTVTARQGTGSRGDRDVEVRYTETKLVGSGNFGAVYKATLCENDETVAIKKVVVDFRIKDRELEIMRQMDHPNLTRLLYFFQKVDQTNSKTYLYLMMEFMPKNLSEVIRGYAHHSLLLPSFQVKLYTFQMLRGVGFLHMHNIMHRDIKPHNLLVDEERGILKVCDFGSAKQCTAGQPNISYICSRPYRAPEVLFGSTTYDTAMDIWSCGVVMAEMCNDRSVFQAESNIDTIVVIIKALGTPTKEDMEALNNKYINIPINNYPGVGIQKMIKRKMTTSGLELLNNLLKIDPKNRIRPYAALASPFFDDLRAKSYQGQYHGKEPQLFDWLEKEYSNNMELIRQVFPKSDDEESSSSSEQNGGKSG